MRSRMLSVAKLLVAVTAAACRTANDTATDSTSYIADSTGATSGDSMPGAERITNIEWNVRELGTSLRRFRPAGWTNDSMLWGLVRDSVTVVNVRNETARTYPASGWALQAAAGIVSWQNNAGAWMMRDGEEPRMLPTHNGAAPTSVLWSHDGMRAILAWEDEGRAHQELFVVDGTRRILTPQIAGYYGDRAAMWIDSSRVLYETVASGGKNGAAGYKESGWRGDLAVLDVASGKYERITDANDGQYLRVAGAHPGGVLVTEWTGHGVAAHWRYETPRWTRTATSLPLGRAFTSATGGTVVLVDAQGDSADAVLIPHAGVPSDSQRITLGRVARDAQATFSPSGVIGSIRTARGTVLMTAAQQGLAVTFVANAGVMLSAGNTKVLIDALFREYDDYPTAPDSTRTAIEQARAPFDGVDVLLVTHRHGDHFHPAAVSTHLQSNPGASLLTSQQVIDSVRHGANTTSLDASRIVAQTTPPPQRRGQTVNGVSIELIGLAHGGGNRHRAVEHLAYIVNIGGRRVLHTGDAELSGATLREFRLDTARIDIALLPSWIIDSDDGRDVVRRFIKPKQVIAIHLPPDGAKQSRKLAAVWPGIVSFWRPLDQRRF